MNPVSVGKRVVQIQSGYAYEDLSSGDLTTRTHILDTKIRYGLFEKIDLSFQTSGGRIRETTSPDQIVDETTQIGSYGFNARWLIFKGDGLVPAIGLELGSRTVRLRKDLKVNHTLLASTLSLSSSFGDHLSLTLNTIGLGDSVLEFTINMGYAINSRLGFLAEYYPRFLVDDFNYHRATAAGSFLNGGAYYNVSKNFQLDIAGLWLVTDGNSSESLNTSGFQFQVGCTGRFDWRD